MNKNLSITGLVLIGLLTTSAFAANNESSNKPTGPDAECVTGLEAIVLRDFPIKDLKTLPDSIKVEGEVIPTEVGRYREGRVVSTIPSVTAFFAVNVLPKFNTLDARNSAAFSKSLPISFLREYGLHEMALLGPDLTKPDPFLDMSPAEAKSPSEDKVDETNMTLQQLAQRMNDLLSADQRTALQNLLAGDVITSVKQVEAKMRSILSRFTLAQGLFSSLVNDKKFLQDIQELLAGNLIQFQEDVKFIDELQARYRRTRDGLEKLANEGKIIIDMKNQILAAITDEFTRGQVEKELVRFEERINDLNRGIALCETFINMWYVIKDTHLELAAGITRALNFTVPLIGAQKQFLNALARQERSQQAITTLDNTQDAMIKRMNERMNKAVETHHRQQVESIKRGADSLAELLVGTILVQQAMENNNRQKVALLAESRRRYQEISEKARAQRRQSGLDNAPQGAMP